MHSFLQPLARALVVVPIIGLAACGGGSSEDSAGSESAPSSASTSVAVATSAPSRAASSGSTSGSPDSATTEVDPTLEKRATAYFAAMNAQNAQQACSFFPPDQQEGCTAGMDPHFMPSFENMKAKASVIEGDEALIAFTGTQCAEGQCVEVTDATQGMPHDTQPFATAFTQSVRDSQRPGSKNATFPWRKIDGQWYLALD